MPELQCQSLDKASTAYGMEISAENKKLMTNNTSGINNMIKVNGHKLETVTSFNYLGSVPTDEGSKPDIDKVETSLERQDRHFSQFQNTTNVFLCHIHLCVCL